MSPDVVSPDVVDPDAIPLAATRAELAKLRSPMAGPVAVVMTMGALHAGHESLLRAARSVAAQVVATIFVNPLQFGPGEDLDRYPRTLAGDLAVCAAAGVDLVFTPSAAEIYPGGQPQVRVDPGPLGARLEGAHRPGHFSGVLTVVLKLLQLTAAQLAFFGEKDYQQLVLVRTMVADLDLPVEIVGCATVRDPDGLAMSSRNRYLSVSQRAAALALPRALGEGAAAGPGGAAAVLSEARAVLAGESELAVDYLELTDVALGPAPQRGPARLLGAVRVGATRLIDNVAVQLG